MLTPTSKSTPIINTTRGVSLLSTFRTAMDSKLLIFNLLVFSSIIAAIAGSDECVYTIYVRTGSIIKGGTDSIISLELYDELSGVGISDLEAWGGLMGSGHDYYERGNLDIFSGRGPCLQGPVCAVKLISDGSGPHHGWYCNYVEVTTTGPHTQCAQKQFTVEQWLGLDVPPYELSATRDYCSKGVAGRRAAQLVGGSVELRSVVSASQ